MPVYEYACRECEVSWELEADVGKAPKTPDCPECKEEGFRYYGNQYLNISFKDDGSGNRGTGANDFHTVRMRYKKFAKEGYDQDSANRFLHRNIRETTERLVDDTARYKPVYLRPDKLVETGEARKLSDKEQSEKLEKARKLTADAYNKAKIDPNHRTKQF